ncbi:NAD(P)-binding protein [Penicillium odoratum]|uniref:NAD(P)-binding protein n=1 Tax=Penicillium odoratum TaxID=1167516 RepID=UPI0025494D15|nr:NAD(P)-binding protein [Penicillium odoratum]KAJ5769167.1 NAD(P)-binding protein [Penicillium odoratum]
MTASSNFGSEMVWLVTGCSSGLGKSLAQAICKAGHRIVATARNTASLSYLPDGPTVLKAKLDVTCPEDITSVIAEALDKFQQIKVVINNAGYGLLGDMEAISNSDARHQLETNFWGPVYITREALRVFREINPKGQGGTIVQISSIGGSMTAPGHSFYHASKFALEGFTKSVAQELRPEWNINLLIVAPGGVRTKFVESSSGIRPRHPAYDLPGGAFNQLAVYMEAQDTWCDPESCAKVLFDAVVGQSERPLPTRLLMGAETIDFMIYEIKGVLEDIDSWKGETARCSESLTPENNGHRI